MKLNSIISRRYIPPLIFAFLLERFVYSGGHLIAHGFYHHNMTTAIDMLIPFVPWMVVFYVSWYVFVTVNYIVGTHQEDGRVWRLFAANFLTKLVCFGFFVLMPTTLVRPEIPDGAPFGWLLSLIYQFDSPDNLFPSIHCLESWMSFIAVRRNNAVGRGYKIFSFIFAITICAATVLVKQHLIVDVFAGVALAELCWHISHVTGFDRVFGGVFKRIFK